MGLPVTQTASRYRFFSGQLLAGLLSVMALAAGCGGGDSGGGGGPGPGPDPVAEIALSGTAQKGRFTQLNVRALPVDPRTAELGNPRDAEIDDQDYVVTVPENQLTVLEAEGTFQSEIGDQLVKTDQPLRSIVAAGTADQSANINIATTFVADLVLRDLKAGAGEPAELIQQYSELVNTLLGLPAGTVATALDFNEIGDASDLTDPNLQLLMLSAGLVDTLSGDQLYADGFGIVHDGILSANDIAESITAVSVLNGLAANRLYDQVLQYSGFELPPLDLGNDMPVFNCIPALGCDRQDVPHPRVSVSGTNGWEASGIARVYLRLNQPSSESVRVTLVADTGTATVGEDFVGVTQSLVIPAGETRLHYDIDVIVDAEVEPTEAITVSIESQTESYPVLQGTADVSVRDGAPSSLSNQDADGTQIASVDLAALCNPVSNMADEHCLVLDGTEEQLALVAGRANLARTAIDLAATCGDAANCPQQGRNWLVKFFLVADADAMPVGEVPLGAYIYTLDSVQLESEPPNPRLPLIRLGDADAQALADDAGTNGWDLRIEARLGAPEPLVASTPLPPIVHVPDKVLIGETLLDVGIVYSLSSGAEHGCATGEYALDAQFLQPFSYFGYTTTTILGSGPICVDFNSGGTTAGPAVMVDGRLDIVGGNADADAELFLMLPAGLYARVTSETQIGPPFNQTVRINAPYPWLQFGPGGNSTTSVQLHAEGWPFVFITDSFALTPPGLELGYSNMRYVMDTGYSSQDPRSSGELYSNDIYYSGVSGQSGTVILGPDGIDGAIAVAGGPGNADHTAFPRARVEWQGFNQALDSNELQAATIAIDEFRLGVATDCTEPGCVLGRQDEFSVAGNAAIDGRGNVLGDTASIGAHGVPRWGARADGSHAWSRPDDLSQAGLKLAMPGYIVPAAVVSDVLIGHFNEPATPGDIDLYPAGTAAFADGNYHPSGLSVGPEIYRDASGQPQVGDRRVNEQRQFTRNSFISAGSPALCTEAGKPPSTG